MSPRLLVVSHSKTGGTARMLEAVLDGAHNEEITGVDVVSIPALEAGPDDVRSADAVVLGTPENFGYMSGALKHFFDSVYHEVLDDTRGLPYGLFVKAGNDGAGTIESVQRIVAGLGWSEFRPPLLAVGEVAAEHLHAAAELGATMAVSLDAGLA